MTAPTPSLVPPTPPQGDRALLHRLVLLRPGELKPLLLSAAYFFFLLCGYYVLRPFRDAMGINGDFNNLPWLWTGTTTAMILATPVFGALVARFPRRVFIPATYRFFAANILVFFALFILFPAAQLGIGYAFYIWLSVFNLFAISVFWGFMADMFTHEQSKRLFGTIAVGGTLGAICGAAIASTLADALGPKNPDNLAYLLLISIALIEIAVQCVRALVRHFGIAGPQASGPAATARSPEPGPGPLKGLQLLARSPYLMTIAVYMLLFTALQTFLQVERLRIVQETYTDKAARTAVFANIDIAVNIVALITQLFVTGRLITRAGVAVTLTLLPLLTIAGFSVLGLVPGLATVVVFQVAQRSMHFAVDRPTREVLYTVLGPEEKYKSKSFIDTFVYRAGDLTGVWVKRFAGAGSLFILIALAISAAWFGCALALGALHRRQAGAGAHEKATPA